MTDQPTAEVALKLISDIAENAIRCHDTEKNFDPSIFLHRLSALRTPASEPVEADDRLAVAVERAIEALEALEAFPSNAGEVEGRITEKGARTIDGCLRDIREAIALLTSGGGQPVTDPYKLDGGEAGE